jgi:hypothetical protein
VTFLLTLGLTWIGAAFAHELGHGWTAEALGGSFVWFSVWPGIEVWPHPGRAYDGEWGMSIAKTCYALGPGWESGGWQEGLVWLMGSGTNLILAALALGGLWAFRPRGWLRHLLIAETMMVEDMLLYVIFPEFFGLPHYVVYGGRKPEPVDGAAMLGCPRVVCVLLVLLVSALLIWGLIRYLLIQVRAPRDATTPSELRSRNDRPSEYTSRGTRY